MTTAVPSQQENAELQLLTLLRGQDAKDFTINIVAHAGRWTVAVSTPEAAPASWRGMGKNFTEAWQSQFMTAQESGAQPWWHRQ